MVACAGTGRPMVAARSARHCQTGSDAGLIPDERGAGVCLARRVVGFVREIRMQNHRCAGVAEEAGVSGLQVALGRQTFGKQYRVALKLERGSNRRPSSQSPAVSSCR